MGNTKSAGSASFSPTMGQSAEVGMTHLQINAWQSRPSEWVNAVNPGITAHASAFNAPLTTPAPHPIAFRADWLDDEYRQAYLEATIEQDVAYQIESIRRSRGLTQAQLAALCGTKQSAIARAEDPTYGRHSIPLLTRIAHALDIALRIKFISYGDLACEVENTSAQAHAVQPFSEERVKIQSMQQEIPDDPRATV